MLAGKNTGCRVGLPRFKHPRPRGRVPDKVWEMYSYRHSGEQGGLQSRYFRVYLLCVLRQVMDLHVPVSSRMYENHSSVSFSGLL